MATDKDVAKLKSDMTNVKKHLRKTGGVESDDRREYCPETEAAECVGGA